MGWLTPPLGWIAINSNGAFRGSIHKVAAGGVLRGPNAIWLGACLQVGCVHYLSCKIMGHQPLALISLGERFSYRFFFKIKREGIQTLLFR